MAWSSFNILFLVCWQHITCVQVWNLNCGMSWKRKGFRLWSAFQSLGLENLEYLSRSGAPGLHCGLRELLEVTQNIVVPSALHPPGSSVRHVVSWRSQRRLIRACVSSQVSSGPFRISENCLISWKLWQAHARTCCSYPSVFTVSSLSVLPLHFWLWRSCYPLPTLWLEVCQSYWPPQWSIGFCIAFLFPISLVSALISIFKNLLALFSHACFLVIKQVRPLFYFILVFLR